MGGFRTPELPVQGGQPRSTKVTASSPKGQIVGGKIQILKIKNGGWAGKFKF